MTHSTAYVRWAGTSLAQEACSGTTGSDVVWNLVPAIHGHPSRTTCPDPADGSGHADGLLVGLDDGDDAFGVSGVGLAGVLHRDLVDDVPGGVAVEPFGDPAADDDRLERVVGGGHR